MEVDQLDLEETMEVHPMDLEEAHNLEALEAHPMDLEEVHNPEATEVYPTDLEEMDNMEAAEAYPMDLEEVHNLEVLEEGLMEEAAYQEVDLEVLQEAIKLLEEALQMDSMEDPVADSTLMGTQCPLEADLILEVWRLAEKLLLASSASADVLKIKLDQAKVQVQLGAPTAGRST